MLAAGSFEDRLFSPQKSRKEEFQEVDFQLLGEIDTE